MSKPKRAGAAASGVGDPAFQFVLSVLKNCEAIKPDWSEVAKEHGIAYGKNASARFKSIIENHGLKFADGKVTNPNGIAMGVAAASSPTANAGDDAPKTPKARGRKRKSDPNDDYETPVSSKKGSAKKGTAKKSAAIIEEEDASEDADVKENDDAEKDVADADENEVKDED